MPFGEFLCEQAFFLYSNFTIVINGLVENFCGRCVRDCGAAILNRNG